jgi:RNA polymerase sigma factor (sigma-70 family)
MGMARRIAARVARGRSWLSDAVQEAALAVCRAVVRCPPSCDPEGRRRYVARAVWNHFKSLWRTKGEKARRQEVPLPEDEQGDEDDLPRRPRVKALESREPDPRAQVEWQDLVHRALARFKKVSPRLYAYAEPALLGQKSVAEVARAFRVSLRAVQLAVKRAREWVAGQVGSVVP